MGDNKNVSDLSVIYACLLFGIVLIINPSFISDILVYKSFNSFLGWILLVISTIGFFGGDLNHHNSLTQTINNIIRTGLSFTPMFIAYSLRIHLNPTGIVDIGLNVFCYALSFFSLIFFMLAINSFNINFDNIKFETKTDRIKAIATFIPALVGLLTLIFQIIKHYFG